MNDFTHVAVRVPVVRECACVECEKSKMRETMICNKGHTVILLGGRLDNIKKKKPTRRRKRERKGEVDDDDYRTRSSFSLRARALTLLSLARSLLTPKQAGRTKTLSTSTTTSSSRRTSAHESSLFSLALALPFFIPSERNRRRMNICLRYSR